MGESESGRVPARLEDFIALARRGKSVTVELELREELFLKVQGREAPSTDPADSYVLMVNFTLTVDGQTSKVSKVYVLGSTGEAPEVRELYRRIANDRLRMDYARLEEANIAVAREFF